MENMCDRTHSEEWDVDDLTITLLKKGGIHPRPSPILHTIIQVMIELSLRDPLRKPQTATPFPCPSNYHLPLPVRHRQTVYQKILRPSFQRQPRDWPNYSVW